MLDNPSLTAFLANFQDTAPPGRAFSRDPDTVQAQVGAVASNQLLLLRSVALTLANVEADPAATLQLLTDWETEFGLPDPCSPSGQTIQQRRNSLLAKIASIGGQSIAYYTAVAAALGFVITITELGDYAWQINAAVTNAQYFMFNQGVFGDYFWGSGNAELECRIRAIMPAHTVLTFVYT